MLFNIILLVWIVMMRQEWQMFLRLVKRWVEAVLLHKQTRHSSSLKV